MSTAPARSEQRRNRGGFRARFTLVFSSLFLAGGSLLIVATYALVDHNLPAHSTISPLPSHYMRLCKQILYQQQASQKPGRPVTTSSRLTKGPTPVSIDPRSSVKCKLALLEASKAGSTDQRSRALNELLFFSLLGLLATTLLAGGVGWILSGRVLRPVRAITGAARRASQTNLGERLTLDGPNDELKELADTFDSMLGRLDQSFRGERLFIANASHELRTPLTAMRTALDVTLSRSDLTSDQIDDLGRRLRRHIAKADLIIEALLTLTISHQPVSHATSVNLVTAIENAVEDLDDAIQRRELRVDLDLQPAQIEGDQVLLERLVANLIENAVRHNNDGGWMSVATGATSHSVFLDVSNSGALLTPESLDHLVEPFNRVEARLDPNGGVGLGLTLVSSIATSHGGTLRLERLVAGGLHVRLEFTNESAVVRDSPDVPEQH